jgi:hypothetical protein
VNHYFTRKKLDKIRSESRNNNSKHSRSHKNGAVRNIANGEFENKTSPETSISANRKNGIIDFTETI